ncbi:MAG: GNAT family N-acetyltransferase [Fastidiosipilaceae bacterium]|jgi:RimJ/RimL family protein N-acetyltransferase
MFSNREDSLNRLPISRPLQGERLKLRMFEEADIPYVSPLFDELDVLQFYLPTLVRPYSEAQLSEMLKDWHDENTYFLFSIVHHVTNQVKGLVNLDGVSWSNRHTEIGIGISDLKERGKGYAPEALRLLIDYCFDQMGMHRVFARIIEGNEPSIRLFEKLGFKREGQMREHVFRDGGWRDMYIYAVLDSEWKTIQE